MSANVSALIRIVSKRTHENNKVILLQNQLIVGRDLDCHYRICSIEISRKHTLIEFKNNKWQITDLQSTNGLFLNGNKLEAYKPYNLKVGDKISLSPEFVYEFVNTNLSQIKKFNISSTKHLSANSIENNSKIFQKDMKNQVNEFNKNIIGRDNINDESTVNYKKNKELSDDKIKKKEENEFIKRKILETSKFCTKKQCKHEQNIEEICTSELTCTICHELFVQAVNLNCSHSFCFACIEQWKQINRVKKECPICRIEIINQNKQLVVDNVIERIVKQQGPDEIKRREILENERKNKQKPNSFIRFNPGVVSSIHLLFGSNTESITVNNNEDEISVIGFRINNN